MPRFEDLAAEGQALVEVGGAVVGVDVATQAELDGHATDTTDVHGIADTALLETTAGAQAKADAAEAAANTYTDNATSTAFSIDMLGAEVSQSNFGSVAAVENQAYFHNAIRTSSGQGAEVVFGIPGGPLEGGTWTLMMLARVANAYGIAHIDLSPDGAIWTNDVTLIDMYAATNDNDTRVKVAGVQVPAGMRYLRIRAASKNALSSAYTLILSGLSGVRTGNFT